MHLIDLAPNLTPFFFPQSRAETRNQSVMTIVLSRLLFEVSFYRARNLTGDNTLLFVILVISNDKGLVVVYKLSRWRGSSSSRRPRSIGS